MDVVIVPGILWAWVGYTGVQVTICQSDVEVDADAAGALVIASLDTQLLSVQVLTLCQGTDNLSEHLQSVPCNKKHNIMEWQGVLGDFHC